MHVRIEVEVHRAGYKRSEREDRQTTLLHLVQQVKYMECTTTLRTRHVVVLRYGDKAAVCLKQLK